jgi:hypothetical protein
MVSCEKEKILKHDKVTVMGKRQAKAVIKNDSIAYFENALVYQYEQNNSKKELWFFVNEKEKQILYVPNDDMIQAIISYPDGKYIVFATDERGQQIRMVQQVNAIVSSEIEDNVLSSLEENRVISQKNIQQNNIICKGYILKYLKMEGSEILFATTQIPINSFQLYGFSRLDGDSKTAINLDFINVFKKSQLITHIERDNFKLELLNYCPNPYEFQLKEYK